MIIEQVTMDNLSDAVYVYEESWRESHKWICSEEFLKNRDCKGYILSRMPHIYLISDELPVGIFYLKDCEIADLYIHPEWRNKGYGSKCIEFAKSHFERLTLTVLSANVDATRMYERSGFRFTGKDRLLRVGLWERELEYTEKHHG